MTKLSDLLLVSDIDGTLMNFPAPIPPRNIEALRRFTAAGGRFSVATGRSIASARPYVEQLPVNAPCILYNGCAIYDFAAEKVLRAHELPDSYAGYLSALMREFPDAGFALMREREIVALSGPGYVREYLGRENMPILEEALTKARGPFLKAVMAMPCEWTARVEEFGNAQGWKDVRFFRTGRPFVEMLPAEAEKGTALTELMDLLGIPPARTVAMGDYYNDAGMLAAAGFAATTAEAPDAVRYLCRGIFGRCEDGALADLIEALERRCPA